jgi:hypothetical protein
LLQSAFFGALIIAIFRTSGGASFAPAVRSKTQPDFAAPAV